MIGRLRVPDLVAGAGGFALLASMFLHWYGLALLGGPEVTAWQAFSVLDVVLALLALVPFALVVTQATRDSAALPVLFSVLTTCAGAIAALLILYRIANQPGPNDVVEVEAGPGSRSSPPWSSPPAAGARCASRRCPAGPSGPSSTCPRRRPERIADHPVDGTGAGLADALAAWFRPPAGVS